MCNCNRVNEPDRWKSRYGWIGECVTEQGLKKKKRIIQGEGDVGSSENMTEEQWKYFKEWLDDMHRMMTDMWMKWS